MSLKKVHKGYGSRTIYQALDFQVRRRERWCVMGINGAGKSTLLKLVAGSTAPDDGTVAMGGSVKMGYFAQHAMELLDGERTVFQSLEDAFPQAGQGSLRALAGCFGFSGDDVEKRCRVLSGGEKARLVMAKMLFDPPNFLVLDEPTNHLDLATKEMLINALSAYEGTMLFVSHDRHFRRALQPGAGADARGHPPVWRRLHRICGAHRPGGAGAAELAASHTLGSSDLNFKQPFVVPANAGTHNHRSCKPSCCSSLLNNNAPGLWVPARASLGRDDVDRYVSAFSRHYCARVMQEFFAPRTEKARQMPGARCTRAVAWEKDKPHELVTTVAPGSPGIPAREWF